jgi:hypothetical protein
LPARGRGYHMATMAAPDGVRWTDGMDEAEKYAFDLVRAVDCRATPRAGQCGGTALQVANWLRGLRG